MKKSLEDKIREDWKDPELSYEDYINLSDGDIQAYLDMMEELDGDSDEREG